MCCPRTNKFRGHLHLFLLATRSCPPMSVGFFVPQPAKRFAARFQCARSSRGTFRAKRAAAIFSALRRGGKSITTLSARIRKLHGGACESRHLLARASRSQLRRALPDAHRKV